MNHAKREPLVTVEPVVVRPRTAAKMLDCGLTKIYELVKLGKLETVEIDADTRITVPSIKRLGGQ